MATSSGPSALEVDEQPVEPVHGRERRVGVIVAVGSQVEDRARRSGSSGEEDVLAPDEHRLDQLTHDAEGELPLELAAPGTQDPQAGGIGAALRLAQQAGLPDASGALDQADTSGAAGRRVDELLERRELVLAFQQASPILGVQRLIPGRRDARSRVLVDATTLRPLDGPSEGLLHGDHQLGVVLHDATQVVDRLEWCTGCPLATPTPFPARPVRSGTVVRPSSVRKSDLEQAEVKGTVASSRRTLPAGSIRSDVLLVPG